MRILSRISPPRPLDMVLIATALASFAAGCMKQEAVHCDVACEELEYTPCTCDSSDPCGWANDGVCDAYYCAAETDHPFDDSADCGNSASCDSDCGLGVYSPCTCGADDPCGWQGDGYCDTTSCSEVGGAAIFDDSADCGGTGGGCDGQCAALQYSACTCGADDPCDWAGDGYCDAEACNRLAGASAFDDSVDCGGTTGDLSFGVTAVRDDLDNNDLEVMADGLSQLGYQLVVRDVNVSAGDLASYLSQDLTTFYHTGHGFEEGIATSDGQLYVDQISLGVRNAIIATCLALTYRWDNSFGASTETVLGYSKVSFDIIDDDVARQVLAALQSNQSYAQAWYTANAGIYDVSDRWVAYVREGGSIVEYSARSGATPQADATRGSLVAVGRSGRLLVSESLLDDASTYSLGRSEAIAVATDAPREHAFVDQGWPHLVATRLGRDEARSAAEAFVTARLGGVPVDAAVDRISEVTARSDGGPEVTVGYIVRFSRFIDGLAVRGNLVADHVTLLVGASGVVAWSRYWPEVVVERDDPTRYLAGAPLLGVGEAVTLAADSISRSVKGELRLVSARAVWGTAGPGRGTSHLVPAYELEGDDGSRVVVDALTGHLVR